MCQGGLKIGRVQGQQQVRGVVGVSGMGRQIPCPPPKAVPRLEAVCEVPAFRGWPGAGGRRRNSAGAGFRKHDFPLSIHQW